MLSVNNRAVHWIATDDELARILARHEGASRYALDTEFSMGKTYGTTLALLQLGWDDEIALIDATVVNLAPLARLFASDALAYFHAAGGDLDILDDTVGARPRALYDTQIAAQFLGWSTPSLATLIHELLGVTLDKSLQRTDWLVRPLSDAARHYAASDVAYLFEAGELLDQQLNDLGRRDWVLEECRDVLARVSTPTPPEELWWRLAKASSIPPNKRLGAQRLCVLRDQRAQRRDRPPSHILSDDAVVALASNPPATPDALLRLKGMGALPEPFIRDVVATLHAPADGDVVRPLPRRALDGDLEPLLNTLVAVATQKAADLTVDAKLLANKKDVTDYLTGDGTRYQLAWRREVIGADFDALRQGHAAVVVRGDRLAIVNLPS